MDRYAIFIDAGYLWAAGMNLIFERTSGDAVLSRSSTLLQYRPLIDKLKSMAAELAPGLELLRVYWYDAAPDRQPTTEHIKIGSVPETKVRIGHLTANGVQKNVDTMLLLDLNTLAQQNSIKTAVIVRGDGDFLEGVITAQALGVKVFLFGIDGEIETVSPELKIEVDGCYYLDNKDLQPFFSQKVGVTPRSKTRTLETNNTIEELQGSVAHSKMQELKEKEDEVYQAGVRFGRRFKKQSSAEDVTSTLNSKPSVPDTIHYRLLRFTLENFDIPWGYKLPSSLADVMRKGFWEELERDS